MRKRISRPSTSAALADALLARPAPDAASRVPQNVNVGDLVAAGVAVVAGLLRQRL
jgi:hypothetical protein